MSCSLCQFAGNKVVLALAVLAMVSCAAYASNTVPANRRLLARAPPAGGLDATARRLQGQQATTSADARAMEMYAGLMRYRADNGLPGIPLCDALNTVAALKVQDNQDNPPSGPCNMHSWSESPRWSGCCFTGSFAPDESKCMWDKPRELTAYTGNGFEISHGGGMVTPESAVEGWKGSPPHSDVILNQGIWDQQWQAIGVGMSDNYAAVWFGNEPCPA